MLAIIGLLQIQGVGLRPIHVLRSIGSMGGVDHRPSIGVFPVKLISECSDIGIIEGPFPGNRNRNGKRHSRQKKEGAHQSQNTSFHSFLLRWDTEFIIHGREDTLKGRVGRYPLAESRFW